MPSALVADFTLTLIRMLGLLLVPVAPLLLAMRRLRMQDTLVAVALTLVGAVLTALSADGLLTSTLRSSLRAAGAGAEAVAAASPSWPDRYLGALVLAMAVLCCVEIGCTTGRLLARWADAADSRIWD